MAPDKDSPSPSRCSWPRWSAWSARCWSRPRSCCCGRYRTAMRCCSASGTYSRWPDCTARAESVDAAFARVEAHLVDLATGQYVEGGDAVQLRHREDRARPAAQSWCWTRNRTLRHPSATAPDCAVLRGARGRWNRNRDPAGARLRTVVDDVRLRGRRRPTARRVKGSPSTSTPRRRASAPKSRTRAGARAGSGKTPVRRRRGTALRHRQGRGRPPTAPTSRSTACPAPR